VPASEIANAVFICPGSFEKEKLAPAYYALAVLYLRAA
jgi:hypothetical protein